jgi:hypothetical protein
MSEENRLVEGNVISSITEFRDGVQAKLDQMKELEGAETELSEIDLDGVNGGWECAACTSYKTTAAAL